MKQLHTLVQDIYDVIERKGGWNETVSEYCAGRIASTLSARLIDDGSTREPTLRLSGMGSPCQRKLWYDINSPDEGETLRPATRFKFLYGDILEDLLLSLAIAAGHKVEGEQDQLSVSGIVGHRDAVIDGVTVDVKSASPYSFQKFQSGNLRDDDPFGYISQLSSYVYAGRESDVESHPTLGAFLVVDKVNGSITLDQYDFTYEIEGKEEEFEAIKRMVDAPEPPDRSFSGVPEGKSGNLKLGVNCSYCSHKHTCWPGLRTFKSSRGPLFLSEVQREPRMEEIK